uniref:F-box protein 34 n=1 Tax=Nothobranchius korthausae TaxID=1143690 RepID=A0A1A8FGS7_9TELE
MHLKSHPKLMRSELRLDATSVQRSSQRSSRLVRQQGELLRTVSSNHGVGGTSRLPLCIISTNFLRCNNKNNITSLGLKVQCHPVLQHPASPLGCENNTSGSCQNTTDDADAALNMSTVIKPGHVREKMAIFASEGRRAERSKSSKHTPPSSFSSCDKAGVACTNSAASTGLSRAVKAKGSWEENGSAKRRRRSGNGPNFPQQQKSHLIEEQPALKPDSGQQLAEDPCAVMDVTAEEEQKVSVAEMVAIVEQRTSQQRAFKPLLTLQRSSTTITLSKTTRPEVVDEVFEAVSVSEMVAKLESECLRRMDGGLSRNNSLRRTVGRVLLAAGEQDFSPCRPSSPSVTSSSVSFSSSSPSEDLSPRKEPVSSPQSDRVEPPASAPPTGELVVDHQEVVGTPAAVEEQEPLPGLLFLSVPPDGPGSELRTPHYRSSFYLELLPSPAAHSDSVGRSLKRKSKELVSETSCSASVPLGRSASTSWDFLKLRRQVQQLLAPQPYLAELPHHLLVKIFLLLPTHSLAALKCTCSSFKFIIETYSVRPADSLWVSDPRYRDDPCKRCKKRYRPGDVSLCRWHHKPYSQALPYGPGNWMCCRGSQREALGCNVGLHDNRWLPTLHSINTPIYKRNSSHDD